MKHSQTYQQTNVLFLLEEESAEEMLRKFLPRCFPALRSISRLS
jgi:hypothetical protein